MTLLSELVNIATRTSDNLPTDRTRERERERKKET